jgi:hypothetical protein
VFKAWSADSGKLPAQLPFTDAVNIALLDTVGASDVPVTVYFQFAELLPASFKTMAEEGPSADSGTRFKVAFANIPWGNHVFVTTRDIPAEKDDLPKAVLLVSELSDLAQGVVAPKISRTTVGGISLAEVTVQNGAGAAIWEWVSADPLSPSVLDDLVFGMVVANPGETFPFLTMLVYGHLGPNSNDFNASASAHIPRFVKAGVGSIPCVSFEVGREDAILAITGGVPSERI